MFFFFFFLSLWQTFRFSPAANTFGSALFKRTALEAPSCCASLRADASCAENSVLNEFTGGLFSSRVEIPVESSLIRVARGKEEEEAVLMALLPAAAAMPLAHRWAAITLHLWTGGGRCWYGQTRI